jgi:hypothetical protein
MNAAYPHAESLPQEQQTQLLNQLKAEIQKLAVETMGEKGHDFFHKLEEMDKKH